MSNHFQHMLQDAFDKLLSASGQILHSNALQSVIVDAHSNAKHNCIALDAAVDRRDKQEIEGCIKLLTKGIEAHRNKIAEFMKANGAGLRLKNGEKPAMTVLSGINGFSNRLLFITEDAPSALHAVTVGTVLALVGKRLFELVEGLDTSAKSCKALTDKSAGLHPISGKSTNDLDGCRKEAEQLVKTIAASAKELLAARSTKTDLFHAIQTVKKPTVEITASLKELEDAADRWLIQYDSDLKASDTKPTEKHTKLIKAIEKVKGVAAKDKTNWLEAAGIVSGLSKK